MANTGNVPAYSSNKAGQYLIPVCTLGAVALALVVARIYTRLRRTRKLYLDDWLIVAAEVRQNASLYILLLIVDLGTFCNRHRHCHRSSKARLG
jgi:cytochrome b561